jgi:hypothetical protein
MANSFISYFQPTNNSYLVNYNTTAMLRFPKNPNTLAGFEPGSSAPEADAMSTEPRRQRTFFKGVRFLKKMS